MKSGEYYNPTRVIFGPGSVGRVAELIGCRSVLLHYGRMSCVESGLHGRITAALSEAGVRVVDCCGVMANPRESLVNEGIRLCREHGLEMVLAVGGGSVIDSAKAIGIGTKYDGDVRDLFEGKARQQSSLPVGVVVTLPGSGSETSPGALVNFGDRKLGCESPAMFPEWAVLDPELTVGLSWRLTGAGLVDAVTHVLERYFTRERHVEVSGGLCRSLIESLMDLPKRVRNEPGDVGVRGEVMWACTLAHNGLVGFGRRGDWSSHQIAHKLGGMYPDIPHGWLVGVVMLSWMKRVAIDSEYFWQLWWLLRYAEVPGGLTEMGVDRGCFAEVAWRCSLENPSGTIGNYERLGEADVMAVLEGAA